MNRLAHWLGALALGGLSSVTLADNHGHGHDAPAWQVHGAHHLSVILGGTHIEGEGTAETIGLDYEYRISDRVGLGAVVEHAAGEIDATTSLAVVDVHPFNNQLIVQLGVGVEARSGDEEDDVFVARTGVLYEFGHGRYSWSPQLHWDYHDGHPNAVVVGVAFGVAF